MNLFRNLFLSVIDQYIQSRNMILFIRYFLRFIVNNLHLIDSINNIIIQLELTISHTQKFSAI